MKTLALPRAINSTAILALTVAMTFWAMPVMEKITGVEMSLSSDALAKNAGGNGGGNGGGNAGGNGGGSGNGGTNSNSNSSSSNGNAPSNKASTASTKEKPLSAQVKSLNSLNRNINGLMNSSDPKVAALRDYVRNYADFELATAALAAGQLALSQAEANYAATGLSGDPAQTVNQLQGELAELEAQAAALAPDDPNLATLAEQISSTNSKLSVATSVLEAQATIESAQTQITATQPGTSEEALIGALAQSGLQEIDVSPDVLDWAKETLGVGQVDGLIDDLVNQQSVSQ